MIRGQVETPLTAKGRQQAAAAAEQLLAQLGGEAWLQRASADPSQLPVIYSSPLARAMIGKEEGDVVEVMAPGGAKSYEIVKVKYL